MFHVDLVQKCKYEEHWENDYKTFHPLSEFKDSQAEGYQFKIPFYAYGSQNIHVVLSATDKPNWDTDSVYEIGKFFAISLLNYHALDKI